MFTPAGLDLLTCFYPIGNTPATCLTRELAPEDPATILLLGCGDARNILFTAYMDDGTGTDYCREIATARNILLFTLLLDDFNGSNHQAIWDVWYHFYLDQETLRLLSDHARKLLDIASSLESWHSSKYGQKLRFCDSKTFAKVKMLWESHCILDLDGEARRSFNKTLEANIQSARNFRAAQLQTKGVFTTGLRSGAPAEEKSANLYRDNYHLVPLELNSDDYLGSCKAPTSFNVIDTSNLGDHLGTLNILIAASPVLKCTPSASIFTECLVNVQREETHMQYADSLLYGDFTTMSILLDLFPVEYWTNISSTSTSDEITMDITRRLGGSGKHDSEMDLRLTWKRTSLLDLLGGPMYDRRLHVEAEACASLLHQVYLKMFQHEDPKFLYSRMNMTALTSDSAPQHHRASFVSLLAVVRSRLVVDWNKTMETLIQLIENEPTLMVGANYLQELYLYLHLFGIYSIETFTRSPRDVFRRNIDSRGLGGWENMPAVVCITLNVPRTSLERLTSKNAADIGTPHPRCSVQSSPESPVGRWQNLFAVEPLTAIVALGVVSSPSSVFKLREDLGLNMNIFETTLGDEKNVYITACRSNLQGPARIHGLEENAQKHDILSNPEAMTTTTATIERAKGCFSSLTVRAGLLSEPLKKALADGSAVETIQTFPSRFAEVLEKHNIRLLLEFPAPVLATKAKTRVARKSSYVEVEAPIDSDSWKTSPLFISPFFLKGQSKAIWNMPRLNLDRLPIISIQNPTGLSWLNAHITGMWSLRERNIREESLRASNLISDVRIGFKDTLHSMFMQFTGMGRGYSQVFGLNSRTTAGAGVHMVISVSSVRLDVTNLTVVLDSLVLPLRPATGTARFAKFLDSLLSVLSLLNVEDRELEFWEDILPLYAERCRNWQHGSSYEYSIRLDKEQLEEDGFRNMPVCSCGWGKFPDGLIPGLPPQVAKLAFRAAISPLFSFPCVDPPFVPPIPSFSLEDMEAMNSSNASSEQKCCGVCGKDKTANGGSLLKCSACRTVKYCSSQFNHGTMTVKTIGFPALLVRFRLLAHLGLLSPKRITSPMTRAKQHADERAEFVIQQPVRESRGNDSSSRMALA
ncbi:hypothetical protein NA57DRAFT_62455 [Rhizodiscina lignyota]|uniref:DUF4470 domain-containing protein n=1 Tax=Rhizodiscina lignyota TaxID=1504668 RepID=A0A9P4I2T3_9PEZI|nr:hypothetical protein NA57DRAFT_62455 [Rhizodiscina lignyota]